ncbi:hypothetical protein HJC99_05550, partial [Candidatus Saccharibacteria bacterium]|nr:hypothetical protein [Candidatus Saccharibacteria bacterium]
MSEDEVFPGAVENDPAGNHAPRSRRRLRKARSHHGPASPIRGRSRVVAILAAVAVFLLTIVTAFVGSGSSQASAPAKSAPVSAPAKPAPAACKASDIKVAAFHTTVTFSFAASGCASGVNIEFGDA